MENCADVKSTIYADVGWVGGSEKVQKCANVIKGGPLVEVGMCYKVISVGLWSFVIAYKKCKCDCVCLMIYQTFYKFTTVRLFPSNF